MQLFDPTVKNGSVEEIHIAVIGADGSGKSALTVKYMTRRYISEYDPNIEDTYCKHETIDGKEFMIWIMDTVEGRGQQPNRYLGWADVFLVVYAVNNKHSFEYAEKLLNMIVKHDHALCTRPHTACLLGTKSDLDRYRQVGKNQGQSLAADYGAEFFEANSTEEYALVKSAFRRAVVRASEQRSRTAVAVGNRRSHSPKAVGFKDAAAEASSSTKPKPDNNNLSPSNTLPRRSKSPAAKVQRAVRDKFQGGAPPLPQKRSSALKLLKIFQ